MNKLLSIELLKLKKSVFKNQNLKFTVAKYYTGLISNMPYLL